MPKGGIPRKFVTPGADHAPSRDLTSPDPDVNDLEHVTTKSVGEGSYWRRQHAEDPDNPVLQAPKDRVKKIKEEKDIPVMDRWR